MALEMKTACERCGAALAEDTNACICSYECTYCEPCAVELASTCPNCTGELVPRPRRGHVERGRVAPYYAAIFTSLRTPGDQGYGETAARMEELAAKQPGFVAVESARTPGGLGITASYWNTVDAMKRWKAVPEHAAAQAKGRSTWYSEYRLRVCRVVRDYRST